MASKLAKRTKLRTGTSWRPRFEALIAELRAHPELTVVRAKLGAPASDAALTSAAKQFGRPLPADLIDFYRELDGVDIEWRHRDRAWSDAGAIGKINIFSVGTWFSNSKAASKPWVPFDWPMDEYYMGLERSARPGFVLVYETDGELYGRKVVLRDYLDALLETRGWEYWQFMFLFDRARIPAHAPRQYTDGRMQALLPRVFERFDLTKVGTAAACPAADLADDLTSRPKVLLAFRASDVPPELTTTLPKKSVTRRCLFYVAPGSTVVTERLMAAIPERKIVDAKSGMDFASRVANLLWLSMRFRNVLYPERMTHTEGEPPADDPTLTVGFHSGKYEVVEAWLRKDGVKLVSLEHMLANLLLFTLTDPEGTPIPQVDVASRIRPGPREALTSRSGIYAVDRDDPSFNHFDLSADGATLEVEAKTLPRSGVSHLVLRPPITNVRAATRARPSRARPRASRA